MINAQELVSKLWFIWVLTNSNLMWWNTSPRIYSRYTEWFLLKKLSISSVLMGNADFQMISNRQIHSGKNLFRFQSQILSKTLKRINKLLQKLFLRTDNAYLDSLEKSLSINLKTPNNGHLQNLSSQNTS